MNNYSFLPIAALLAAAFPLSAASPCDAVVAASIKVLQVPAHLYTSETGDRTRSSETIYIDGATYFRIEGRWQKSGFPREPLPEQKKEFEDKIGTCTVLRDEAVGGEPATLYKVRNKSEGAGEAQVWISKLRGLLLKQSFGGDRNHMEIRYEYANVTAPAVTESKRK